MKFSPASLPFPGVRVLGAAALLLAASWVAAVVPDRPADRDHAVAPVRRLQGHGDVVWAVAFSPDGHSLLSAGYDRTIRLWDAATGAERKRFVGHTGPVLGVAFAPDGRQFASVSADHTVRLWDSASGNALRVLQGHTAAVNAVVFAPDGKSLVTGGADKVLRVWDVTTGAPRRVLEGHTDWIWSVAVTPDSRFALSGSADQSARLWDLRTGTFVRALKGQGGAVTCVAFATDGKRAATGSADGVRVWGVENGQLLRRFAVAHGPVYGVAFSPRGQYLLGSGAARTAFLWDVSNDPTTALRARVQDVYGQPVDEPDNDRLLVRYEGHIDAVYGVAFAPDGRLAASAGRDSQVCLWPTGDLEPEALRLEGHTAGVQGVAFTPDGKRAVSVAHDGTAGVWDLETGKRQRVVKVHTHDWVQCVAVLPDGRRAVSGGFDRLLRLWDLNTGKELRRYQGHDGPVLTLAVSADGRQLISGGSDKTIRLWDVETGREVRHFEGVTEPVARVALAPDGRRALACYVPSTPNRLLPSGLSGARARTGGAAVPGREIDVWDVATGKRTGQLRGHRAAVVGLAFLADGVHAVSAGGDHVHFWDLLAGTERLPAGFVRPTTDVAVSPDGRLVVRADGDHSLRVCALATGQELRRLDGHTDKVTCVAVAPDGRSVLSGSADHTARLWKLAGVDRLLGRQTGADVLSTGELGSRP